VGSARASLGTWLWLGAAGLLVAGLVLVRVNASISREMSVALASERIHIEKMTAVRRDARQTQVALLERWLAPVAERSERQRAIETRVAAVRSAVDEFASLRRLSVAEDAATNRFIVAVAIWSNRVHQAMIAADGAAALGELRGCLDAIDSTSNDVLSIESSAGSSSDERVVVLHRTQGVVQVAFVAIAAGILAIAFAWWRRYLSSERGRAENERLARLRAQFFANVSHELRTPLIAIRGFAAMVEENESADSEVRDAGRRIDREAQDLLDVITNILDASKLEAGKVELRLEDVPLAPIVSRCMQRCQGLVGGKPVLLVVEVPTDLPRLRVDVVKMQQVFTNLLANAIKFTDQGHVRVRARDAGPAGIAIEVEDTGVGIRDEAIDRIWRPFEQDIRRTSRRPTGTGLGLPIVRSIVELHGGSIAIKSKLGVGTCVTFTLPRELRAKGAGAAASEVALG
jgi:signal transduction histidine kinase